MGVLSTPACAAFGIASWYGPGFEHRLMANGCRFHRFVLVTITDRGPYRAGRLIDLSAAAAGRIGMRRAGLAEVELEVLPLPLRTSSC
jgi:rare lipoprotein A